VHAAQSGVDVGGDMVIDLADERRVKWSWSSLCQRAPLIPPIAPKGAGSPRTGGA